MTDAQDGLSRAFGSAVGHQSADSPFGEASAGGSRRKPRSTRMTKREIMDLDHDVERISAELSAGTSILAKRPLSQSQAARLRDALHMALRKSSNARYLLALDDLQANRPGLEAVLHDEQADVYIITFDHKSGWWVNATTRDSGRIESISEFLRCSNSSWKPPSTRFNSYVLGHIAGIRADEEST